MKDFSNIEAIILDKDGVFVDFNKLWLRVIAYRAQLIAELASDTSEMLQKIRAACIRAMGVDEDDDSVDPAGPAAMPPEFVRLALATAVFINKNEVDPTFTWTRCFAIVDESMIKTAEELNIVEMSEAIDGSIEKIKELAAAGLKLGVYTSDSEKNAKGAMEKFGISDVISALQAGELKTEQNYRSLCDKLGVKPENTLLVTDSPIDLQAGRASGAYSIVVFTGVIDKTLHRGMVNDLADEALDSLADLDLDSLDKQKALA